MTPEQIKIVCYKYEAIIDEHCLVESIRYDDDNIPTLRSEFLEHAKWMLEQIPQHIEDNKIDKANRWLGFIQGTLWTSGLRTIEEMKNDNR
jgi:hypothetical protein